ncbi:MAG: porin [Methanobacteriota archaeon]|nr:MAG: porin [Euryarchaeota archaeon]|tara:strand:+ start:16636 stop:17301 length:666 start_codon:yes stop_codon:yes gene_type:complete
MLVLIGGFMTYSNMSKGVAEFVGTFFLTLTILLAAVGEKAGVFAPIAIGLTLMVMIYALGYISGAHFNPAVSIGLFVKGDCSKEELPIYLLAQITAGLAAFVVGTQLIINDVAITEKVFDNTISVIMSEALFTFALVFVIINVATEQSGNQFYGAAIGLTVMAGAFTVGEISLGSFNPAVTTMLVASGKMSLVDSWMHIIPQLIGAIAAVYLHKTVMVASE